jgi:hypothetical protein
LGKAEGRMKKAEKGNEAWILHSSFNLPP